jgi:hypothetical protein
VLASEVVGVPKVFQQIPLLYTKAPPSLRIFPPLLAPVLVIWEAAVVIMVAVVKVEKVISFP